MSTRTIPTYEHDPQARIDYPVNWTEWLETDTITASVWASSDPNLILENGTFTTTSTLIWAKFTSPPEPGTVYLAINHITTAAGREEDQTVKLKVKEH